jgi:hypothetical protein
MSETTCQYCGAVFGRKQSKERHEATSKRCLGDRRFSALEKRMDMMEDKQVIGGNTTIINNNNQTIHNTLNYNCVDFAKIRDLIEGTDYDDLKDPDSLMKFLYAFGWKPGALRCTDFARRKLSYELPDGTSQKDNGSFILSGEIFIQQTSDGKDFSLDIRNTELDRMEEERNSGNITTDELWDGIDNVGKWRQEWKNAGIGEGKFFKRFRVKLCRSNDVSVPLSPGHE